MSLLQLLANSSYTYLNIPQNFAIEYFTEYFTNNSLEMQRDCDAKCPEYLEIELNPNIDRINFKNICHKICLEMKIGGSIIFNIPLRFMMLL